MLAHHGASSSTSPFERSFQQHHQQRAYSLPPAKRHGIFADNNSILFPRKLWEVASSADSLITWNEAGDAVVINEAAFEARVMTTFPELVVINTFANIRRQFREYGFDWTYERETDEFYFSHPSFRRDSPELVALVVTRRKRSYAGSKKQQGERSPWFVRCNNSARLNSSVNALVYTPPHQPPITAARRKYQLNRYTTPREECQSEEVEQEMTRRDKFLAPTYIQLQQPPSNTMYGSIELNRLKQRRSSRTSLLFKLPDLPDLNPVEKNASDDRAWSQLVPWLVRYDAELCNARDIQCLEYAARQARINVQIPIYFYGDDFNYNVAVDDVE